MGCERPHNGAMSFRFETQRMLIRPWRGADRPALDRMAGDAEMMRFVSGQAWSAEKIDEFLERQSRHLAAHGVCFGAAEWTATGEVVGVSGMQPLDNGEFEIGWWVWKEYWGRGLALESIAPFIEHARSMGLTHLWAVIDPPNAASIRVATKLGMYYTRTVPARETVSTRGDKPAALYRLDLVAPTPA